MSVNWTRYVGLTKAETVFSVVVQSSDSVHPLALREINNSFVASGYAIHTRRQTQCDKHWCETHINVSRVTHGRWVDNGSHINWVEEKELGDSEAQPEQDDRPPTRDAATHD